MLESKKEVEAMRKSYVALKDLPTDARPRVFEWLQSRLEWDDTLRDTKEVETKE